MQTLRNFVNGRWESSTSADTLDVVNPATAEAIARIPVGTPEDVEKAVTAARSAQRAWARTPLDDRLRMLDAFANALEEHTAELARLECQEMGKPISIAEPFIANGIAVFRRSIDDARTYAFEETISDGEVQSMVIRHPVGVVAQIVPWNFTVTAILLALGPLLAAGNAVIIKPSEKAPLSARKMLEVADLPDGVLNLLFGDSRAGAPLAEHPGVQLVHFTGSVESGRSVGVASAKQLHRAVLELGGKDPVLVDSGVDPVKTAAAVAFGAFVNTGQICTSMERVYVHRDIAEDFIEALTKEAETYTTGDGTDSDVKMGPLVDERQRGIVHRHVSDAVEQGAKVLTGGFIPDGPGFFYPATVLAGVTDDMLIMTEETFGPVAPVKVVDSFDAALDAAAGTAFGLAATVYSNDPTNIRNSSQIPVGLIWINEWQGSSPGRIYEPAGNSGMGAVGGHVAFDAATRPTTVILTRSGG